MTGPLELLGSWLISLTDGAAPMIDLDTAHVHQGKAHLVEGLSSGVADAAQLALLFWNPNGVSGYPAHVNSTLVVGGQAYGYLYEDVVISATGTVVNCNCYNRTNLGSFPPQWMAAVDPSISDIGSEIYGRFVGGSLAAAGPLGASAHGEAKDHFEWVLDPAKVYLFVIVNDSGAIIPANVRLSWYEPTNGLS